MRYSEIHPKPPLNNFVECFWTLEGDGPSDGTPERILPDGCVELILNFGARFSQHSEAGRVLQPRNFLVGRMTGPILISPTGNVELLGIRFHPGGTSPFLRLQMNEVTDHVADLGAVSSELERELLQASEHLSSLTEKDRAVETVLMNRLRNVHVTSSLRLAARIVASAGRRAERVHRILHPQNENVAFFQYRLLISSQSGAARRVVFNLKFVFIRVPYERCLS